MSATELEPNLSLISLDNSQETIENNSPEKSNLENFNPTNVISEQKSAIAANPDVHNGLISDDEDGNMADGSEIQKLTNDDSSSTENEGKNKSVRKASTNSLSRKQISRQTANSRNQKHDKVASNTKRKPKHPGNNSSTATSATEPKRLPLKSTKKLTQKPSKHIKPAFNSSTSIIPHNYSPPKRQKDSKILESSAINTSDPGNAPTRPKHTNLEARTRREAQLNKPTRIASKHFRDTHQESQKPRKSSIVDSTNPQINQYLRRKSYRPGSAPILSKKINNRGGTGQSSREDSTTDVDRVTQKGNKIETPTRPVSAATLKMRARRQQDMNQGQVHLQRTSTAGDVQVRRLARLSIQGRVGNAPSPKTKIATSKIGSLDNKDHIPGGGAVKIYDQSPSFKKTAQSKIGSLENAKHSPGGGKVKITTKKVDYSKVSSKCGSLENNSYTPGGGNVKILDQKIKIQAKSKIGSLENKTHSPGGGNVKILNRKIDYSKVQSKSGSLDNAGHRATGGNVKIFDQKLNFKKSAKSKVGSMDNIEHKPGGGDVLVYDEANVTTRKFIEASIAESDDFENAKGDF